MQYYRDRSAKHLRSLVYQPYDLIDKINKLYTSNIIDLDENDIYYQLHVIVYSGFIKKDSELFRKHCHLLEISDPDNVMYNYLIGIYLTDRSQDNGWTYLKKAAELGSYEALHEVIYKYRTEEYIDIFFRHLSHEMRLKSFCDKHCIWAIIQLLIKIHGHDATIRRCLNSLRLAFQQDAENRLNFIHRMDEFDMNHHQLMSLFDGLPKIPEILYFRAEITELEDHYVQFLMSINADNVSEVQYDHVVTAVSFIAKSVKVITVVDIIQRFQFIIDDSVRKIVLEAILHWIIYVSDYSEIHHVDLPAQREIDELIEHFSEIPTACQKAISKVIRQYPKIDIAKYYNYLEDDLLDYYRGMYIKMKRRMESEAVEIECIRCINTKVCLPYSCGHYVCDDCHEQGCRLCSE